MKMPVPASSRAATLIISSMAALVGSRSAVGDGSIINLGTLGGIDAVAYATSADGSAVAGSSTTTDNLRHAFRWTSTGGGMQDLGTLGIGTESCAYAISADGSIVTGDVSLNDGAGTTHAFRWSAEGGMQNIGTLGGQSSYATGISADGSIITGSSNIEAHLIQAFRWTSAGMDNLGHLGGFYSFGHAISADGSTITGSSTLDILDGLEHAFRWTSAGGMVDLGTLGGERSIGRVVSADGSVVAGSSDIVGNAATHAFRWTSDGMRDLGTLGGADSFALAISADASAVAGSSFLSDQLGSRAFLWTESLGMVDLNTYLPTIGVDLTGWYLMEARGLSADGSAIAGYGMLNGNLRAFLVTIPAPGPALAIMFSSVVVSRRRRAS
jgi:probable HAF family extracellular repeat protein